jgi:hypothetical protein
MRIYTKLEYIWNGHDYVLDKSEFFEYDGEVALACGSTSQQNQISQSQQSFMTQAQQQSGSVFGDSSTVFNGLMSTFAPIVAAGPSQTGFSQQELANLQSSAITQTGQAYKNEKAALGNAQAAAGGGNVALPSGVTTGENLQLAENAGNQTASELSQITQADYAQGNANYNAAVAGEEALPGVFNAATSSTGAATSAGTAAANTANQVAQENNSWMSAVSGALGGALGAATGGLTNSLFSGKSGANLGANDYLGNLQGGQAETTSYTMPDSYQIS